MIKPDAVQHAGAIIQALESEGFLISKLRMCHLTKAEACQFYDVHNGKPFFDKLTDFMSSGCIVAMELLAKNAIARWRALIGPTDSNQARASAPNSLRAQFGTDGTCNACHGSDAVETADQASSPYHFLQYLPTNLPSIYNNSIAVACQPTMDHDGIGKTTGKLTLHSFCRNQSSFSVLVADEAH